MGTEPTEVGSLQRGCRVCLDPDFISPWQSRDVFERELYSPSRFRPRLTRLPAQTETLSLKANAVTMAQPGLLENALTINECAVSTLLIGYPEAVVLVFNQRVTPADCGVVDDDAVRVSTRSGATRPTTVTAWRRA